MCGGGLSRGWRDGMKPRIRSRWGLGKIRGIIPVRRRAGGEIARSYKLSDSGGQNQR
jgi:hypothetical protein